MITIQRRHDGPIRQSPPKGCIHTFAVCSVRIVRECALLGHVRDETE